MYFKDFDKWNNRKKQANNSDHNPPSFKEREIWWMSIGINVGFEEDGKGVNFVRPVLIVRKFNKNLFLGVPMSTKLKNNKYYIPVTLDKRKVSVLTSQIRAFSSKRMWNKKAELDLRDYNKVKREIRELVI